MMDSLWKLSPLRPVRLLADVLRKGRAISREHGVSLARMLWEQARLARECGLGRKEYFSYELWRPDLSWDDKRSYVSVAWAEGLWYHLSPQAYSCLLQNKLLSKQLFAAARLPHAKLIGIYDPEWGYASDGLPLRCPEDVRRWLADVCPDAFVVKPIEGQRGHGIHLFERVNDASGDEGRYTSPETGPVDVDGVASVLTTQGAFHKTTYLDGSPFSQARLIEERLLTHSDLRPLSPHACGHVRLVTLLTKSGDVELFAGPFHVQTLRQSSANYGGCVGVGFEVATGELGLGRVSTSDSPLNLRADPVTGAEFYGVRIPWWEETKELARRAQRAFPFTRALGWDIAVTDDGPVLIEGNIRWSMQFVQVSAGRGLLRGAMLDQCADIPHKKLRRLARSLKANQSVAHDGARAPFTR